MNQSVTVDGTLHLVVAWTSGKSYQARMINLKRRRDGERVVLTGEDLCNLGPVALLQERALMALLGIEHVERNGHHYYRGLSAWPADWQSAMLAAHGDLYERHHEGFASLGIRQGRIQLSSVNAAAEFRAETSFDPARFERGLAALTTPPPAAGCQDHSEQPVLIELHAVTIRFGRGKLYFGHL
ncbi:MAG: hypothetical protein V9F04_00625 [Dermatophilaceae bacterium]